MGEMLWLAASLMSESGSHDQYKQLELELLCKCQRKNVNIFSSDLIFNHSVTGAFLEIPLF